MGKAVWSIPETLTHFYYSPLYASLTLNQKLAYNRLHACYMCEMYVFFEANFPAFYVRAAEPPIVPAVVKAQVASLAETEARHALMFRELAAHLAPELYTDFRFHFVLVPPPAFWLLQKAFSQASLFPSLFWIVMLMEERAVYYAQAVLDDAAQVDPLVVEVHRKHLHDEGAHLDVDEHLLALHWDANRAWVRWINSRMLRYALREFLTTPKRAGIRLIRHWIRLCPELAARREELERAMRALGDSEAFHASLFSRTMVPRSFSRFDTCPELHDLGKSIHAYSPEPAR